MTAAVRRKFCFESGQQMAGQFRVQAVARFAVNAHDLLFVGHDAGLDARVPRGDSPPGRAQPMFCSPRSFSSRRAASSWPIGAEKFRRHVQRGEVAGHVGRAAGHEAFALEIHDRHRRFRRNARHAAPDELVEHHVADDQHAGFGRGSQDLPRAGSGQDFCTHVFFTTD